MLKGSSRLTFTIHLKGTDQDYQYVKGKAHAQHSLFTLRGQTRIIVILKGKLTPRIHFIVHLKGQIKTIVILKGMLTPRIRQILKGQNMTIVNLKRNLTSRFHQSLKGQTMTIVGLMGKLTPCILQTLRDADQDYCNCKAILSCYRKSLPAHKSYSRESSPICILYSLKGQNQEHCHFKWKAHVHNLKS